MDSLKVAIVGGGIGGCAAGLALLRAGHTVDIYEQVPAKAEVGAGLQMTPNATRVLISYGVRDALEQVAVRPFMSEVRRWKDGRVLSREELGPAMERDFGSPYYHVHRADLLRILSEAIPKERIHLGKRCIGISQEATSVRVSFDDGSVVSADAVVGADGIHSRVRHELFGKEAPRFSGLVAFRGLVPRNRIAHLGIEEKATNWLGPGRHLVHYYVSGGRLLNFVAVSEQESWQRESWTDPAEIEDVLACFEAWHPQIHAIIRSVDTIFKWALFDRDTLAEWSRGCVTLLGDACHPMLPFMAQGAAQAIEDSAVLAICLQRASELGVPAALKRYENLRRPRTAEVHALSRRNAEIFHLHDGPDQKQRDEQMAARSGGRDVASVNPTRRMLFSYDALRALDQRMSGDSLMDHR